MNGTSPEPGESRSVLVQIADIEHDTKQNHRHLEWCEESLRVLAKVLGIDLPEHPADMPRMPQTTAPCGP